MSQKTINFADNPYGKELLDDYLAPLQNNMLTSHSGVSRPPYAQQGTKWLDISSTPWLLKMYDGTDDVILGEIDPDTNKFIPSLPLSTQGDLIVQGADGNPTSLSAGENGYVLTSNGPGEIPSYEINPIGVLLYSTDYNYKKDQIVIAVIEDETALYKSLIDNNLSNDLTDDTKWEKLAIGGGGNVGNIGDIKYTTANQVPNGGAWCDGSEYTQAQFPDIYQMLVNNMLANINYTEYNNSITNFGFCGFFGLDTTNKKFKVPTLKDMFIKAGTTAITAIKESLPNHIHTSLVAKDRNGFPNGWDDTATDKSWYWRYGNAQYNTSGVSNNSTYKNGAKVNPDHVVYRAYVVLYTSAAEASEAQAAEFIQGLSTKADKTQLDTKVNTSVNNISATGYANLFANLLPDYGAAISVNTSANYTAPNYGWFRFNSAKDSEQNIIIKDVTYNNEIYAGGAARSYSPTIFDFIFVEKGHVYQFTKNWGSFGRLYFYPIRGV